MIKSIKIELLAFAFLLMSPLTRVNAQSDLSFYHLGELTPQNNIYNPVFFPDAKFYISLPVLSGVSINMNNSFAYNDLFESEEGSDSARFVPERLLSNMKSGDRLGVDGSVSLLQVGFQVGTLGAVQLFANERVKSSFFYPKHLLEYVLDGNGDFIGQEVIERNLRVQGTYYREYGIGYSHQFTIMNSKKLRIGLKLKYLQGFAQIQVDDHAQISFLTDLDNKVHIGTNQSVVYTSGFDSMEEGYLMSNGNTGFGFDIGADLQVTPKLRVALAINDIGSINWKEDVKAYELIESEAVFGGLDLKDLDDAGDILTDTLEHLFDYSETVGGSFKSRLNTRIFMSGAYQLTPKGTATATIMTRNDLGNMSFTYGLGYTHRVGKMLTVSTTFSKKPKQGFTVGGGFGAQLGIIQLYTSVDNVIGFTDVRKMQNVNARAGINFLFGRSSSKKKEKQNEIGGSDASIKRKSTKSKIGPFPEEYDLDHLHEIGQ